MRFLSMLFCVVSILSTAGICVAADAPDDRLVQTLMRASGLEKQIEQIPLLVQQGIREQHQEEQVLSRNEYEHIQNIAKVSFDAKSMKYDVSGYVKSNMAEKDIKAALGWLESPLGRKITKLEEDASTPEAFTEMTSMASKLAREHEGTSRFDKISRFDRATMATETSANVMADVQLAMMTALSAAMKDGIRPSYKEIQEVVNRMKPLIRNDAAQSTALNFMYAYRTLTESEIDQYIAFAETEAGKRYHLVTSRGMHDAIVKAARMLGTRLGLKMEKV